MVGPPVGALTSSLVLQSGRTADRRIFYDTSLWLKPLCLSCSLLLRGVKWPKYFDLLTNISPRAGTAIVSGVTPWNQERLCETPTALHRQAYMYAPEPDTLGSELLADIELWLQSHSPSPDRTSSRTLA